MNERHIPTYDELLHSMQHAIEHPADTGWDIYRYLHAYAGTDTLGGSEARTLLNTYISMSPSGKTLLHSCILQVAVKMCGFYPDFRFPAFLQAWGFPQQLREEDGMAQTDKEGRRHLSLREKTVRTLWSYLLRHPSERAAGSSLLADAADNSRWICAMIAVKVFQTERDGRKYRMVKLIGAAGEEAAADAHLFPCKPWEIQGRMFDVLASEAAGGKWKVHEAIPSVCEVGTLFPPVTGYVERIDAEHGHYHIYDTRSRHFVADRPSVRLQCGDFVLFSPIVPGKDRFKSAIVHQTLTTAQGADLFGLTPAVVTRVVESQGFFRYRLSNPPCATDEGEISMEGTADLALCATLRDGDPVRLLLFLTRGRDGNKHNHVARVFTGNALP